MAACHLITDGDLAPLGYPYPDELDHVGREVGVVFTRELLYVNDLAAFAVRHPQRGVLYLAGLLTEYSSKQLLLGRQLGFALGCDLADQDISRPYLGADPDDAFLVQVTQALFAYVRNILGNLLFAQLGLTSFNFVFLNMNGGELIQLDQPLADDDGIFKVISPPGHKGAQHILAQGKLTVLGCSSVGYDLPFDHRVTTPDHRALIDACALVGPVEFG